LGSDDEGDEREEELLNKEKEKDKVSLKSIDRQ